MVIRLKLKCGLVLYLHVLYVSYCIPVILLLLKGRDNIVHGPFWLGGIGLVADIVCIYFTIFAL